MKKIVLLLAAVVLMFSACGEKTVELQTEEREALTPKSSAYMVPENAITFKILNSITIDIYEVFISPAGTGNYGKDALKAEILPQGGSAEVSFVPEDGQALYDIKVLAEDGNYYTWQNVDLSSGGTVELYIKDGGTHHEIRE